MKASNLFWGFFFITIGTLYLVARYTSFIFDWYAIWELWPIIIILAGLAIILKGTFFKPIISVLFGISLAFLVFGFFSDVFDEFDNRHYDDSNWEDYSENYYNLDYDGNVKHVNLNIEAGAGKFNIEKTTDKLVKGYSRGNIGKYNFTQTLEDSVSWVKLKMDDFDSNIFGSNLDNQFKLSLNEIPTYSLDLQIGAAKSYFNLIPFKVKNVVLKTGATDTKIKIGNKAKTVHVDVEMGAASLKIYIPKSSGCKIMGEMVLMTKRLDGFKKNEDGDFVTRNYKTADENIIMNIEGGVASLDVKRY